MTKQDQNAQVDEALVEQVEQVEQPQADDAVQAAAEQEPSVSAEEAAELPSSEQQIEALQRELDETRDQALRTLADAQNIRRRAEIDVENARKYALEKFAGELLVVADNLERALDAADRDNEVIKPLAEGIDLTQKSLLDVLRRFNVEQVDPAGEPFDPQFHQAISMVPNPEVEPNTVVAVMQKGYCLNGRLIRPAMVMVSKAE